MSEQMDNAFYHANFIRKIKEEIRQNEKFLEQAMARTIPNPDGIERFKEKIASQKSLLQHLTPETPEFVEYVRYQQDLAEKAKCGTDKKVESILRHREEQATIRKTLFASQRAERRDSNRLKRNIEYEHRRMLEVEATLPPYIRDNLRNMPNNKGYIHKGIWYFGSRPADGSLIVMHERRHNGAIHVHEILYGSYPRIYEKPRNHHGGGRKLIEDRPCPVRT